MEASERFVDSRLAVHFQAVAVLAPRASWVAADGCEHRPGREQVKALGWRAQRQGSCKVDRTCDAGLHHRLTDGQVCKMYVAIDNTGHKVAPVCIDAIRIVRRNARAHLGNEPAYDQNFDGSSAGKSRIANDYAARWRGALKLGCWACVASQRRGA